MSNYYNVVPWYNSVEWMHVFNKICEDNSESWKAAVETLLVWKARCPSLPSGIESTLSILEVVLEDKKATNEPSHNDIVLRLAYSSALMRFVNHMLDSETVKGASLYQAAMQLDVPDWIIDLRHDTAHSNNLPPLELLREAANISLKWLIANYWERHKEQLKDYQVGEKIVCSNAREENRVSAVMNFCLSLSICANNKSRIRSVADIPDKSLRESIMNDIKEFFGNLVDLKNLKNVTITMLISLLYSHSRRLLKSKDLSALVNKSLLSEDSMFLSIELADVLDETNILQKSKLSKHYVQAFETLLTYLQVNDVLLEFVLELIAITQRAEARPQQCHLAALWISEILQALGRTKMFMEKKKQSNITEYEQKNKQGIRKLYYHWFPKEKDCSFLLDLQRPVPQQLSDIDFIQPIISTYNPYLTYFIKSLLNLLEPELPNYTVDKICSLAEMVSNPQEKAVERIYTVEDLQSNDKQMATSFDSDSDCLEIIEDDEDVIVQGDIPCVWKLASKDYDWSVCPIGILPWQSSLTSEPMHVDS